MGAYYQRYLARRTPWSPDIDSTFAQMNPRIYGLMQGPSEFTITGTLKDYDRTAELGKINVPTLFVCGAFDEARPPTVARYSSLVPESRLEIIPNAGHLTMQDEPQRHAAVVRTFLHEVESR
jgi:proline iminopeptidase